jgi:hypothetical protein
MIGTGFTYRLEQSRMPNPACHYQSPAGYSSQSGFADLRLSPINPMHEN